VGPCPGQRGALARAGRLAALMDRQTAALSMNTLNPRWQAAQQRRDRMAWGDLEVGSGAAITERGQPADSNRARLGGLLFQPCIQPPWHGAERNACTESAWGRAPRARRDQGFPPLLRAISALDRVVTAWRRITLSLPRRLPTQSARSVPLPQCTRAPIVITRRSGFRRQRPRAPAATDSWRLAPANDRASPVPACRCLDQGLHAF